MAIGELTIKNDKLSEIIGRLHSGDLDNPVRPGQSVQDHGENVIGTYALDIIFSGWEVGKELDFTYETLADLPAAVESCYRRDLRGEHKLTALDGTTKALAAYFFALAMNEHGCFWQVRKMSMTIKDPLWADVLRITTGEKLKTDFLLPVSAGCKVSDVMGKQRISFDLAALFREYKTATGVDLQEHGLRNIAFSE